MTAQEVIRRIQADGWRELRGRMSGHKQFKHPDKPGKVTVPMHTKPKDLGISTLKNIELQSGVKLT
ncbi:MAG: type II toxin-antitoxin system HicA family toxin [Deltaproteobacteria bacterium]|jgi:predicted RNA binding protein YcfA (HicA-like mRNA interferase family)|nr:type II toxin-antitoxin system HicA family toxin [Deltaproteobacteria bacterium]